MSQVAKSLLRRANPVLHEVMMQITQQIEALQRVGDETQQIIAGIAGGMWEGEAADAFIHELDMLQVRVQDAIAQLQAKYTALQNASDHIEDTDGRATALIDDLRNLFDQV